MKRLIDAMMNAKKDTDDKLLAEQQQQIQEQLKLEAHINQLRAEQVRHMNMAQQGVYHPGWNDPRGLMGAVQKAEGMQISGAMRLPSSEEAYEQLRQVIRISENLRTKVERTEKKVEMLSGFYHWVTEVHPELAAQYKAMRELYEAANAQTNEAPEREA